MFGKLRVEAEPLGQRRLCSKIPPSPEILDQHDVAFRFLPLAVEDRPAIGGNAQGVAPRQPLEVKDRLDGARGKAKELNGKAGFRSRPGVASERAAPGGAPSGKTTLPVTSLSNSHPLHSTPLVPPDPLEPHHPNVLWNWRPAAPKPAQQLGGSTAQLLPRKE